MKVHESDERLPCVSMQGECLYHVIVKSGRDLSVRRERKRTTYPVSVDLANNVCGLASVSSL